MTLTLDYRNGHSEGNTGSGIAVGADFDSEFEGFNFFFQPGENSVASP